MFPSQTQGMLQRGFLARSWGPHFQSLPKILRRVPYPVESFDFKFVLNRSPSPLLDGICNVLGNQADLLDQLNDGQANDF
jgi:hypothetical protein